jgi:hypothetical protein
MKRPLGAIAVSLLAAAILAACSSQQHAPHGTIAGALLGVGGPAPGTYPLPGHVVATSSSGTRYTVATGVKGRYNLSLPPGTYRLTGHSPRLRSHGAERLCAAMHPVHVAAGRTTSGTYVTCMVGL